MSSPGSTASTVCQRACVMSPGAVGANARAVTDPPDGTGSAAEPLPSVVPLPAATPAASCPNTAMPAIGSPT